MSSSSSPHSLCARWSRSRRRMSLRWSAPGCWPTRSARSGCSSSRSGTRGWPRAPRCSRSPACSTCGSICRRRSAPWCGRGSSARARSRSPATLFLATQVVTVIGYLAWPVAPPRMAPELGFSDTLATVYGGGGETLAHSVQSPYAAMPSGHVAFAVVAAGTVFALVRSRVLRAGAVAVRRAGRRGHRRHREPLLARRRGRRGRRGARAC